VNGGRRAASWLSGGWLVVGVVVGVAGILLVVASDHARDHAAGVALLVLAAVAMVAGARLVRVGDTPAWRVSLATSVLWVAGAAVVFLNLSFTADRLLFAGVPALVGCLTAAVALRPSRP
jgi:hypothetical protein